MDRTRIIQHRGKPVLLFDYHGLRDPAEAVREIEHSMEIVGGYPPGSLRVLTDVTDSHYDTRVAQKLKELAAHNKPYVAASAVVGVSGIKRAIYSGVVLFSKRNIQLFDHRQAALDWLVSQPVSTEATPRSQG